MATCGVTYLSHNVFALGQQERMHDLGQHSFEPRAFVAKQRHAVDGVSARAAQTQQFKHGQSVRNARHTHTHTQEAASEVIEVITHL